MIDGSQAYQVEYKEKDYETSPEQILQHIYKYMHDIADSHCANVDDSNCVITVPLGFTGPQREKVRACAQKAGFKVVQVISECVAACLAHGLEQDLVSYFISFIFSDSSPKRNKSYLQFELRKLFYNQSILDPFRVLTTKRRICRVNFMLKLAP